MEFKRMCNVHRLVHSTLIALTAQVMYTIVNKLLYNEELV